MDCSDNFVKPQYNSRCFSDIPQTIKDLLLGTTASPLASLSENLTRTYDTVILFFIDAFGWRFIEQFNDHPFLQTMAQDGVITKITSQFPSTTSAHTTSIHTGQAVGQSGIFEWQYYEPQLDAIIAPLLFSYAGATERDTLPETVNPRDLYPAGTFYQDLGRAGISSHVFQYRAFTPSTYSNVMFDGAQTHPYLTFPEALTNLQELLTGKRQHPTYIFLYLSSIDTICHRYGPSSLQAAAEIDAFLTSMDRLFLQKLIGKLGNTLFMLAADHGQVDVDPQTTIYLNVDPAFIGIKDYLKSNRQGELLVPAGSVRDMFLYIHDQLLDEAHDFLARRLEGRAKVCKTQDLITEGLFGPEPLSPAFHSRVGNLVILPYQHGTVWWYEPGKFEMNLYGHHGGLTKEEMEIPLILYPF